MKTSSLLSALGIAMLTGVLSPAATAAVTAGDVLFIDFGKDNTTDGIAMASPDTNGHYWNDAVFNFSGVGGGGIGSNPTVPALSNLVTQSNVATGVGVTFSNGWQANGFNNGGLLNPSAALLGDFAFKNVTGDYYFFDTSTGTPATASLTFTGLNPALTYNFSIFATRDTTAVRTTSYSITDPNGTQTVNLQTSGPGIGDGGANGNNNKFANLNGITAPTGSITITVDDVAGGFAYIGALKMTAVPETSSAALAALGALGLLRRRRKA